MEKDIFTNQKFKINIEKILKIFQIWKKREIEEDSSYNSEGQDFPKPCQTCVWMFHGCGPIMWPPPTPFSSSLGPGMVWGEEEGGEGGWDTTLLLVQTSSFTQQNSTW